MFPPFVHQWNYELTAITNANCTQLFLTRWNCFQCFVQLILCNLCKLIFRTDNADIFIFNIFRVSLRASLGEKNIVKNTSINALCTFYSSLFSSVLYRYEFIAFLFLNCFVKFLRLLRKTDVKSLIFFNLNALRRFNQFFFFSLEIIQFHIKIPIYKNGEEIFPVWSFDIIFNSKMLNQHNKDG